MIQFGGLGQNNTDNLLLQNFIRSSIQRDAMDSEEGSDPAGNNSSASQEGRSNYIFNMLLNSASNQEGANNTNTDSFANPNQHFGTQGSESNDMSDN